MIEMTKQQEQALMRKYAQSSDGCATFDEFKQRAEYLIAGDGAIVVAWCGMFLCIETDGHCHT